MTASDAATDARPRATALRLPRAGGTVERYAPGAASPFPDAHRPCRTRVAFAAAHVVADPLAPGDGLDWEATLAFRRHLWAHGLRVAEAMDTAQRGMGLDWDTSRELIRRSAAEARAVGGAIAAGAGTDHLQPGAALEDVRRAYEEQCAFVESTGAHVIVMASRALAAAATTPQDYVDVYAHVLRQLSDPAILHWLGPMFDPALDGYWGSDDLDVAADTLLAIIAAHRDRVEGVKVSLLDHEREVALRERLPDGVRLYTGDDFNYPELIRGGSDALLGIFDAIAPAAAAALTALDADATGEYERILAPTVPLARHIFERPTYDYKTGIVFLAYLNGHQRHFRMVAGRESARSITHLAELFVLADRARLIRDPGIATARMRIVLELAGVDQP